MTELKQLDLNQKYFTANGKAYFIEKAMSIERYARYEQFQIELGFGVSFDEMTKKWQDVYNLANNTRFADIAVMAYNTLNGIQKIYDREPVILKMCALFINEESEDRRVINEDMISNKINDWQMEGLDIGSFFQFALGIIPGFTETYNQLFQSSSMEKNEPEYQSPDTSI